MIGGLKCALCKMKCYNSWFITCFSGTDMLGCCWAAGERGEGQESGRKSEELMWKKSLKDVTFAGNQVLPQLSESDCMKIKTSEVTQCVCVYVCGCLFIILCTVKNNWQQYFLITWNICGISILHNCGLYQPTYIWSDIDVSMCVE